MTEWESAGKKSETGRNPQDQELSGNRTMGRDERRVCQLCEREVPELTLHHLVPRDEGGGIEETVELCRACHSQIHATFTNKELARHFHTLESIRRHEQMAKFLRWIRKQDPERKVRIRRNREKRGRK